MCSGENESQFWCRLRRQPSGQSQAQLCPQERAGVPTLWSWEHRLLSTSPCSGHPAPVGLVSTCEREVGAMKEDAGAEGMRVQGV